MSQPPVSRIIEAACDAFGVTEQELRDKSRKRFHVKPRQIVMYLAMRKCGYSSPRIGRILERDHTTILHGCRVIEERIKSDQLLRGHVEAILDKARSADTDAPPEVPIGDSLQSAHS